MPSYELGRTAFLRETGLKHEPGDTADLTEEQAEQINAAHPGTLKPVRIKAVGTPNTVIRKDDETADEKKSKPKATEPKKSRRILHR
jgi:hypothetical protein